MPRPQKSRLTKRADDWREQVSDRQRQNDAEAAMRREKQRHNSRVLDEFGPTDTSKPAKPKPISLYPTGPGKGFRRDVRLDRSQVQDRRGDTPRPNRRKTKGGRIY